MAKTIRLGIIGCGGIAVGKHLPALLTTKKYKKDDFNIEIAAFCDLILEKAETSKEKYGDENSKVTIDYKELIADSSIDVIYVLTPNNSHSQITIEALDAGKHVMCEKPMAKTYKEALAMEEAALRNKKLLTIGYQNRFTEQAEYLKTMCTNGDLGDIYYAKAHAVRRRAVPTWGVFLDHEKQGGGPLIDIGTHALDLVLWFMDNYEVKSVIGNVYQKLNANGHCGNAFGDWKPEEYTVEDSAFGFITMKNGATISLDASWALNTQDFDEASCQLCGTKAGADTRHGKLIINGDKYGKLYITEPDLTTGAIPFYEGESINQQVKEQITFFNAVIDNKDLIVYPKQAILVTQILEAIYESSKTGKLIQF